MIEILMVDDEEAFLEQAKIFLEKSKDEFQVSTVETVDDALTHLEQDRYDIIVSDYMMPVKNGLDFLEIVRKERDSDIPFIIFTGKGREEVAIEALNLGADRYIQKGGSPTSQYGVLADAIRQEHEHFQSEKKYRTVVGSSHDAIYIYKGNEFLFVNDQAVETTGYSKEELYDMNMWDLLHPEDKEMVRKREERRVKGEDVPSKYEARLETKKGEVKHLQFTVGSIGFEDQKAFLGSARDITELKKAYEEREEYIEELQFLNEVMLDVARMENIDEICDYIAEKIYSLNQENHVLVSLYDRNIEAIQVRSIAGFGEYQQMIEDQFVGGEEKMTFDPEVLDDWEEIYSSGNLESMPEGLYSIVKGVLSKEEAKELEELIGVEEVYYVGFALDKKPYGGISIFKPEEGEPRFKSAIETIASHLSLILQRKQDERRQRLSDFSLEQASLEIYWITPEGKFIFTNEIVSEKLGYSKDELQDMYVWDLDPDFEKDIRREHWERLKEEKVFSFESEHETKDGEIYPVEVTSNYLEFDGREYEFAFAEDISERKEAERKIKESEEKYRSLFNSIHDAILVTDTERNIIDCNPAFTDIFGYELDEIEGKKTEYVYHDVEQFEEMGEEIREHIGEIDFYYTIDYEKESGDVFPGETKVFYLRDDEGEITGFIGVIRDITEKEKKEKELRDERNFIEQITETSPVCITKVDKDGNITYANDKAEDVLGLSKSEIKGRTYHDVDWKITDYDGGPFDKEELPFNLVKEKGEAVYDVRHAIEWPDGERKLLSINASPLYDEEGNFDGMVATIQNVTEKVEKKRELKETKNRLSEIIEGVSVPIFVIDDEHTVTHWNRALEELCGLSKDEMIGTKDPWRAFYAEERPVLADLVVEDGSKEKMEEHYGDNVQEAPLLQDTYRGEYLFTDMGKNGVWMYFTASPIKDSNGNVIGAIETLQDVTERKKTELDLREKERAIKNSINGIAITDLDGTISYVNKALVEMFGYDMEEDILGEDTLKYFYDEEKAAEAIGELLDEGEWQGELKAVKKDGELITVYLSANLILDEDGNPTGLLGTMIDITERKEAEQELEEVKERYDAIFERSMDAVYIHDLEGNILDVNQATFELLGYEKGDLEDLKFTDILPEDHLEKAFETLEEVMETGSQDELTTFEVKAENGERILIETKSSLIYKDGEPYAVLGIGRDITERRRMQEKLKESERKFRDIFENLGDPVIIKKLGGDDDGRILDANEALCDMLGYSIDELIGMNVYDDIVSGEPEEKSWRELKQKLREGDRVEFTVKKKRKEGSRVWVEVVAVPMKYEGEDAALAVNRDVTEKEEKEQELRKERKKFQQIFNNANDAIYLHELTEEGMPGNFIEVNDTAMEILGYSRDEFLEMSPEKIDASEKADEVPEVMKELVDEGETKFEMVHQAKDGTKIPVEIHSHLFDLGGEKRVLSVVRDITERKEAERKLKRSERRFRRIFEASPDSTFLLSKEGVFRDVNEAALDKLGYDKEEIVGKELQELPFLGEEAVEKTVENFMKRMKGEEVPPYEIEMISKDGDTIYAEINAKTFIEEEFEGEVVIARDITEKKKANEEREELLHDLGERYKELNCLYTITRLGTEPSNSVDEILEGALEVIPGSWQYPEVTEARIVLNGDEYATDDFQETDWCLSSDFKIDGEKIGDITVCYTEEKPEVDGDPFSEEEKELIDSITTIISSVIHRHETERKLEESEKKLKQLYQITPKIEAAESFDELNDLIIETAKDILDFDVCSVEIEEDGELVVKASTEEELVEEEYSMPIDKGIAGKSYRNKDSYLTGDIHGEEEANPTDSDFRSAISIPMGDIGVFQALSYEKDYYDEKDLELAELFVSYVTEAINRISAVKALKESEERYRTLVETSFAGIGITDFDDNLKFVNERFAEMLGYEKEELEGKNLKDISPEGEVEKFEEETEIRKKGETSYYETRLIRKDGEIIDILVYGSPFKNAEGEYEGTMGVVTDITKRKEMERKLGESEEKFRTITESSADAIFITNQEGNYEYVNETASELLGYSKEELLDMNISDISPEEDIEDNINVFQKLVEEGEIFTEINLVKKDGTVIPADLNAVLLPNGLIYGSCRDITDRKEVQEREELLHSLLRHDVKNKSQLVQGYLQLLMEDDLPDGTEEYVEKALKGNKESVNLIQKIRLLLSAHKEEHEPVNIASTIHKAVDEVEAMVEEKGMELVMECPSMECEVKGGPLLKEVFSNLMENSIYHSKGSQIKVSGEITEDEVVCIIEDDGKGIPEDKKDTIFEKGFTTDVERGTGLGLFLVKMLLESYGGSIEVKDSELGGARFDVHLRRA